jgi:uncharacterized protein YnzC (UPF0291/DUF896 family)
MATIKASKLKEIFTTQGVNEGFIDALINVISKRKADKKSKELTDKLKKTKNSLRQDFIDFYGGYDKIPDSVKKVIER